MKSVIRLLSLVFFIIISFDVYASDKFEFRKTYWGMSKQQVIQSEKPNKPISSDKTSLMFRVKMFSHPVIVSYTFDNNKLISVICAFYDFTSMKALIEFYNKLDESLSEKYKKIETEIGKSEFDSVKTYITMIPTYINSQERLILIYGDKTYIEKKEKTNNENFIKDMENL